MDKALRILTGQCVAIFRQLGHSFVASLRSFFAMERILSTPDLERVQMSPEEQDRLRRDLPHANCYLEFGMGGSSLLAVRAGVKQMVSIDSDPEWVKAVRSHPEIAPRCADGSVSLLHADIGPVEDWGRPLDRSAVRKWSRYISTGWAECARRGVTPDMVLVDGRFRVACCISVAIACLRVPVDAQPCVLMHDVDDKRAYYRDVLNFFEQVDLVDTLLIMRPRPDISPALLLSSLLERQFDFT